MRIASKKMFFYFTLFLLSFSFGCSDNNPRTVLSLRDVTSSSLTLSWPAFKSNLSNTEYKVVLQANSSENIDTIEEADVSASSGSVLLVLDWTANIQSSNVTNLEPGTTYYYTVLIRETNGNITRYAPESVTTLAINSPVAGTALSFSATTSSSTVLTWGAASDAETAQASLKYKVVKATSPEAIDTSEEADAISGSNLILDWTANALTSEVTALTANTTYYFAVLVKDEDGNKALYTPQSVTMVNATPTVGTAISFDSITSTFARVQWGAASDHESAAANLQYKLMGALSTAEIDTLEEADAVTDDFLVMNWTANVTSFNFEDLAPDFTLYLAVIVKDEAGNKALYAPQALTTLRGKRMFLSDAVNPNFGGSSGADSVCGNDSNKPITGTYKALVVDATRRACSTADCLGSGPAEQINWVVSQNYAYYRTDNTTLIIQEPNNNIVHFGSISLSNAIDGSSHEVWTGLNADWTTGNTCSNWTSTSGVANGAVGVANLTDSGSISSYDQTCDRTNVRLICVEQ